MVYLQFKENDSPGSLSADLTTDVSDSHEGFWYQFALQLPNVILASKLRLQKILIKCSIATTSLNNLRLIVAWFKTTHRRRKHITDFPSRNIMDFTEYTNV